MQQETLATVIENVGNVGVSLLKDHVLHRQQRQQMQDRMEMEKELAKTRAQQMNRQQSGSTSPASTGSAAGGSATAVDESSDPLGAAADMADQYANLLENARQSEACGMCRMLIEAIMEKPLSVQRKALPELRSLKNQSDNGASTEELKSFIQNTDVLKGVMKEETVRRGGLDPESSESGSGGQSTLDDTPR